PRGRATQRLLRHHPATRAKQARDVAEGAYLVGLVHQEKPGISQVERSAYGGRVELVDVTSEELHVAQLKRRYDRPGPLDCRLAEVDATYTPGPPRPPPQDPQPATAAA